MPDPLVGVAACPTCAGPLPDYEGRVRPACTGCGYDLTGLGAGSVCPECGTPGCESCRLGRACVACGYALGGLGERGVCPECGAPFSPEIVVLYGVPRLGDSPVWRKVAWGLLGAGFFVAIQFWPVVFMLPGRFVTYGVVMVLMVGAAVVLLVTGGKRERLGSARMVFGVWGFSIGPPDPKEPATHRRTWDEVGSVRMDRVGPLWKRLRLSKAPSSGVVLDTGIRCPDADAAGVRDLINRFIVEAQRGGSPGAMDESAP